MLPLLLGTMLVTGCMSWFIPRGAISHAGTGSSSDGIDPVTMAGIEASNRATDEAVARQNQWANDQANAAAIQAANDAANAANAAAASAAASAAAANQ